MKQQKPAFDAAATQTSLFTRYSAQVQADAAAVLADPSKAASWGAAVQAEMEELTQGIRTVCDLTEDMVAPNAKALVAVAEALQEILSNNMNGGAYHDLGIALDAVIDAARPLVKAHRELAAFHERGTELKKQLVEYVDATSLFPRSQELYDRGCFLAGLAYGFDEFRRQLEMNPRVEQVRKTMADMRPVLESLPQQYRGMLEKFETEMAVLEEGLPGDMAVKKPLRLRQ